MKTTLDDGATRAILAKLSAANHAFARSYPGEPERRQPVHTVYGGAQLYRADTTTKLGALARKALETYAPDSATFAEALGLPASHALTIHERVRAKLEREPVEDFRIDFEDGFGTRPDEEEDEHAARCAKELALGLAKGSLPPFVGMRIKSLGEETRARALRTLDLFVTTLVEATGGALPPGFVITLPKVTVPEQVSALVELLELLESGLGLARGALKLELMVETTQAIIDAEGRFALPRIVQAARGRCIAAHFGTYDYTAGCDVTAAHQSMSHPACDFARHVMQVSLARTGVSLSDGATNVMPVPVHRAEAGRALTLEQELANRASVRAAWRKHFDDVHASLVRGFYQGWDLHPAQLPTRYAALYAFFLSGFDAAAARLVNFVARAAQASLLGDVFDDAATGQGLLNYFLRGIACGAFTEEEVLSHTGLTHEEVRLRSFAELLEHRRARA